MSDQTQPPRLAGKTFFYVLLLASIGDICELILGDHFIFAGANRYRAMYPVVICLALALVLMFWILADMNSALAARPDKRARPLFIALFTISMAVAAVVAAPLGYSALAGRIFGGTPYRATGIMTEIGKATDSGKGCHHSGTLEFEGNSAKLCIRYLLVGAPPKAGDTVEVIAQGSPFGTTIKQIKALPRQQP